jgi:diguanylate cyclase (GGDEF)-like protein/PAS domain S-box-containing protein
MRASSPAGSVAQDRSIVGILVAAFIVVAVLLGVMTLVAVQQSNMLAAQTLQMYRHPLAVSNAVLEANAHIIAMDRYLKDAVLARTPVGLSLAVSKVNAEEAAVFECFERVSERFLGDKQTVQAALTAFVQWRNIRAEVIELVRVGQYDAATAITQGRGATYVAELTATMDGLIAFARAKAASFLANSERLRTESIRLLWLWAGVLVALIALIAGASIFMVRRAAAEVRASAFRYRGFFEHSELSIWIKDLTEVRAALQVLRAEGLGDLRAELEANPPLAWRLIRLIRVVHVNEATLRLFGLDDEAAFFAALRLIIDDGALAAGISELCAIWDGVRSFRSEVSFRHPERGRLDCIVATQIPGAREALRDVPMTVINITERIRAESALRLAASVFEQADEGIVITDTRACIIDCNDAFTHITGYPREAVVGLRASVLQSGRHGRAFYAEMWRTLLEQGHWRGEIWNRRRTGEVYPEMLTISAVRNQQGVVLNYVGLFSDITHLKAHEHELERLAHFDALTGLANRVLLADRLRRAMANAEQDRHAVVVAYIDLDDFKGVNDGYGHLVGDDYLIAVAANMKGVMRASDTLARIGGDEFVAVFVELADWRDCTVLLERVLEVVARPVEVQGGLMVEATASIGVSHYPQRDALEPDQLLRQADQAMYLAKQAGRNCYRLHDSEQEQIARDHLEELRRVRSALHNDEFVLYYQPTVNMCTGAITGVEALIRWQHPERGLLPPGAFLPIIEGLPLSVDVDTWVLETALTQMEAWHQAGLAICVSVNLCARQLQHEGFPAQLAAQLAAHPDAAPSLLYLEILETSVLKDIDRVSRMMHACLALGVRFALDDFGTGYSSLTYLKHLPVCLKRLRKAGPSSHWLLVRNATGSGRPRKVACTKAFM